MEFEYKVYDLIILGFYSFIKLNFLKSYFQKFKYSNVDQYDLWTSMYEVKLAIKYINIQHFRMIYLMMFIISKRFWKISSKMWTLLM
jgi:hypothetical protein